MRMVAPILMILFLVSGCASKSRTIASIESRCSLVKHKDSDLYQLKIGPNPVDNHWYSEKEAYGMMEKYHLRGKCHKGHGPMKHGPMYVY
jgi:hypothetical protein